MSPAKSLLVHGYEVVIGFETHTQLTTHSKIFSRASTAFGAAGMPVGLQLIGNYLQEARLLNVAHRLQQATDWHQRKPNGI